MDKTEIKSGDVVTTKVSSTKMTVKSNGVTVNWFDENDRLHQEVFNEDDLTLISS